MGGFVFRPLEIDKSKFLTLDNDPRGPWKADPFDAPNISLILNLSNSESKYRKNIGLLKEDVDDLW